MSRTKCTLRGPKSGTSAGRSAYQLAGAASIQTPLARLPKPISARSQLHRIDAGGAAIATRKYSLRA